MTEVDAAEVTALLDDVRRELAEAVDELDRTRSAHRAVESLLLAVLEHVPIPLVVIDAELRVRATSNAAERVWGASLDAPMSGLDQLDDAGVVDACRASLEAGHVAPSSMPDGYGGALLDEPGTNARYVVVWSGSAAA